MGDQLTMPVFTCEHLQTAGPVARIECGTCGPLTPSYTEYEQRLRLALRNVVNVLGPEPGCSEITCPGCHYEMAEALRVAREALA